MEKVIKLIMNVDKSIKIFVDDEEKHTIAMEDRSISADEIYKIIGFTLGDRYSVVSENESSVDTQVLDFFSNLFTDITKKTNSISADNKTLPIN